MALQHLRSSTADKRPTPAAMAEGQLALNSAAVSPGLFFKNASGALVKVGPVHVGTTAPNATPASGGESGNSVGEQWLDTSGTNPVLKIWDGSTWASEAGEFVNASGDTMTGALVMDNQQQVRFRETTANGTNFIALQAPASVAADRTLTLPDVDGTLVSSGDTGTVTSTMILDGTIVNADINASAAIVDTKLDTIATAGKVSNSATTATNANTASAIVARDASGNFSAGTITAALTGAASANVLKAGDTMTGVLAVTAGTAALPAITPSGDPNTGIYSPGADQLAISTNGTGRLFIDSSGRALIGTSTAHGQNYLQIQGDQTNGPLGIGAISLRRGSALVDMGANSTLGRLEFAFVDGGVGAQIAAVCDAAGAGTNDYPGRLVFSTTADNAASPTERMRLDSSGGLQFKGAGTAGVTQAVSFNGSAPVNSLVIDSTGKVGLGTSSPTKELEVSTSSGATISIRSSTAGSIASPKEMRLSFTGVTSNGVTPTEKAFIYSVDQQFDTSSSFLGFGTNLSGTGLAERMRITAEGRVGIGTTTVSSPLHVKANSTEGIRIESPDFTGIYGLLTSRRSSGAPLDIAAIHSVGSLAPEISFSRSTNGSTFTESARIDSSGRLLVGTSTSTTNDTLVLQGNSTGSTGSAQLWLKRNATLSSGTGIGDINFGKGANTGAKIGVFADANWTDGSSHPSRLVFSTTADGASSPTEHFRILQNGSVNILNSGFFVPSTDNAVSNGASGFRWSSIWAANGTIQTSDQRAKSDIADAQLGSEFIKSLRPVSYKWIEGGKRDTGERDENNNYIYESVPGTRTHWGFIAQEVKQVVDAAGVDFGGWVLTDKDDPDSQQALRYDQFIAPLTKALQEALAEIDVLKAKVAALEAS